MKRYQKRRAGLVRERWIMAGTAVFVLAALTLTGIYVRDINKTDDDGYVVDFSAMEDNVAVKMEEIQDSKLKDKLAENMSEQVTPTDDLDFDPYFQEANSNRVTNYEPATDLSQSVKEQIGSPEIDVLAEAAVQEEAAVPEVTTDIFAEIASEHLEIGEAVMAAESVVDTIADTGEDILALSTSAQTMTAFQDGDNLVWPIAGNVLINYSMDKTIYFPTLQQYKYNPAIIIQADEGELISAAATGKVSGVYQDNQLGNVITLDLGNGYELTYGQLANILVSEGSYVAAGDVIAEVSSPTKYFSVEGTNVYFKMTKDGKPVNPMSKLQ